MRRYPNKFISKKLVTSKPIKIPKNSAFEDADTGILYKWDGIKWVKKSRQII